MCLAAIASGEENCKDCPGYTTCPESTVWEDDYTEADAWCDARERWDDEYYDYAPW